jgi:hypothetical protein
MVPHTCIPREKPLCVGQGGFNVLTRELIATVANPFAPSGFVVGLVEKSTTRPSVPIDSYFCGIHAIAEDENYNTTRKTRLRLAELHFRRKNHVKE